MNFLVDATSVSTVDLELFDRTMSDIVTGCCTGSECDATAPSTPPTPPAVPPTPSAQTVSLQWLLDNVDNMIAEVESCCCQDKIKANDSSVSVVTTKSTIDTSKSTTPLDKSETGAVCNH